MKAPLFPTILLTFTAVLADDTFDFRSADRPTFDKQLSVDEFETLKEEQDVTVLDVRLIEDFEADPQLIPGATYRNPDDIGEWASTLPADGKIVLYCEHGKWVSQKAASFLESKGYEVYSIAGGIEAWKAQHDD